MSTNRKVTMFLTAIFCLTALVVSAGEETVEISIQQAPCCFENPRFSGTCQVTPGPEENCGSILSYLNNPNSVGKVYCGNTKIRGGWTTVACESSTSIHAENSADAVAPRE